MNSIFLLKVYTFPIALILALHSHSLFAQLPSSEKLNFVVIVTDDLSWEHLSINGCKYVNTPNIDRLAREGINFSNAFVSAPSCTPSRSAILAGRNGFELAQAASLWGYLPLKYQTYTELLEQNGYKIGGSGKGMGPGVLINRAEDPVGKIINQRSFSHTVNNSIVYSSIDYAENLNLFIQNNKNQPFCFWMGPHEPHRPFSTVLTNATRGNPESLSVPAYLPDHITVKKDFNDYLAEVEMIDKFVEKTLYMLEMNNLLDNTVIIFTSDNGMPFPRAKTHLYDSGTKVPLIIWRKGLNNAGRVNNQMVSLIDIAPTILDYANVEIPDSYSGKSLVKVIEENRKKVRKDVLMYTERHSWRKNDEVYVTRAIRNQKYLLIWNVKPERLPVDTNDGPTLNLIKNGKGGEYADIYNLSFALRPEVELYKIADDPEQMNNLSNVLKFKRKTDSLKRKLEKKLFLLGDPRVTGHEEIFLNAPYFGLIFQHNLLNYSDYLNKKEQYTQKHIIELLEKAYQMAGASEEFEGIKKQEGW